MSRGTLVRILEAFFKRWYLYVLPMVAMLVLGLAAVTNTPDRYTSQTTVLVESGTQAEAISQLPDADLGSFLTPAQFSSQELDGFLATDEFVARVLELSGVDERSTQLFWQDPVAEARASLRTNPTSENHVQIAATTPDPQLSQRLAEATVRAFILFKIELQTEESAKSEELFTKQLEEADAALAVLDAEMATFIDAKLPPGVAVEDLPAGIANQYQRLQARVAGAQANYDDSLERLTTSQLSEQQAKTEAEQSIRVFDPPQAPTSSDNSMFEALLTFLTYVIIGAVLTLVGPVVAAMANRNVLFPDDLAHLATARVIGIVPRQARSEMNTKRASAPELDEPAIPAVAAPTPAATDVTPLDRLSTLGLGLSSFEPPSRLDRIVPSSLIPRPVADIGETDATTTPEPSLQGEPDARSANG